MVQRAKSTVGVRHRPGEQWLAEHVAGATAHILDGHGHLSLALGHFDEILDDLCAAA
jgi:hypothetical protein